MQSGVANRSIDLLNFKLKTAGIAITKPGQIVSDDLESDNLEGYHIYFDLEFLKQFGSAILKLRILSPEYVNYKQLERLEENNLKFLMQRMETLYIQNEQNVESLLGQYLKTFLLELEKLFTDSTLKEQSKTSNKADLFRTMVLNTLDVKKGINDYAHDLAISPKHLHKLVKNTFGKSPSQLKTESLLTEALFQLSNTNHSISEIAFSLGYEDAGYFSRFINKHISLSPSEYRKQKADNK